MSASVHLQIDGDGSAFETNEGARQEVARILRKLAGAVLDGSTGHVRLGDANGNRVGVANVVIDGSDD